MNLLFLMDKFAAQRGDGLRKEFLTLSGPRRTEAGEAEMTGSPKSPPPPLQDVRQFPGIVRTTDGAINLVETVGGRRST